MRTIIAAFYFHYITAVTDHLGDRETYKYGLNGSLISGTTTGGNTTRYGYDGLNELISKRYADDDGKKSHEGVSYSCDKEGRRLKMTDETGDTLYTYDRKGNLTSVDDSEGNTIGYTYDVAGNVSSITYPDGGKVSYEYDKNNNLTEVSDATGKATRYSYDALNRVTITERPNNINTSFTYDAEGRVTNLTNYNSLTKLKISSYSYTYDELGYITEEKTAEYLTEASFMTANPLTTGSLLMPYGWGRMNKSLADSLKEKNGGILPAITKTTKYTYDEDGKLTRAVEDGWRKAGIEYIYEYDAKGNRTYFEKREAGIAVEKAESTYDKADRLISSVETTVSDTGKTTVKKWIYTYDGDGNLISEESNDGTCRTEEYTYVYEAEDRLKAVYDPEGLVAAYTYDGDGNRVLELSYDTELKGNLNNKDFTTVNAAEAALTEYLGDEERALYEITRYINDVNREYTEALMERDGSGALATAYVYGNERLSVRSTKKENGYYLYDGRGSVTNIVSIMGERLESYSYDPSGRVMRATSTNRYQKTFYGYNAEGYDPKTGSVYLRARYYNTRTGSFIIKDTYLGDIMDPLSRNRYAYAQGNAVYYIDPDGHEKIVVSGGNYSSILHEMDKDWDNKDFDPAHLLSNKFNFIAPAIKLIKEYAGEDEDITWIIADAGWTLNDKADFKNIFASKLADPSQAPIYPDIIVRVIFIDDADELINYINSKNTYSGTLSEARKNDPITEFTVFSHGFWQSGGILSLAYNYLDPFYKEELDIYKEDINKIEAEAFAADSHSYFYSCNTAIGVEGSFAQKWSEKTGGYVTAFNGKTDYAGIYSGREADQQTKIRRGLGYVDEEGASDYPVPGHQIDGITDTETVNYKAGKVIK